MKIYTKTGDTGTTSLVGGTRTTKNSPRLEAYGAIDELNSWIGLIAAIDPDTANRDTLQWVQNRLFDLGTILATEADSAWQPPQFPTENITRLEKEIDRLDNALPRHNRFILPGGSPLSANTQIARTVARRAERRIVTLTQTETIQPAAITFINRLSDYLFVLARYQNIKNGINEIFWQKDS
ncbi:MAG: cob(I)yrinic acid a,c-diamide adenosyltransferase [Bacteroidales bacterium]|nr:cob(I)yrinic acid a,c-diamide adenosyltransferase [Bacteroidales bacterium]